MAKRTRKWTQVENLPLLATPFGQDLRELAFTCDDLRSLWSRTNLYASRRMAWFSPFGHPTQVNASVVTSINLLSANKIQDLSPLNWVFGTFEYLGENLRVCLATQRKFLCELNLLLLATTTCESV